MSDGHTPEATAGPAKGAGGGATPQRTTLSKELSDFLLELSIAVHRYAMYPEGHPSLEPAVENLFRRLAPVLDRHGSLNIGVAQRQLVIGGVATEARHPVLSELARRLHELQLGAISFQVGVGGEEIIRLLATLAQDLDPYETPLGLLPEEELPSWPHISIHPVGYDRLAIRESDGESVRSDRAGQLWLGLAQAALGGTDVQDPSEVRPEVLAQTISAHRRESAYDQVIVGYMLQLAQELKSERGAEAERIRRRMTSLVREMDPDTLARLVELGGDPQARRRFVLDANQSLSVDAVMKILDAAASASGQNISTSMTRMLSKLAMHADENTGRLRTQAGAALRDNVERLLYGWTLDDPNPDHYTRLLDHISRAAPIFQSRPMRAELETDEEGEVPGPLRLIQMALEVDAWGPTVEAAVLDVLTLGLSGRVLALVHEASEENDVARRIQHYMTAPPQVRRYLSGADVEETALEAIAGELGKKAIPLFLDALADSESRSVRRKVFDRVHTLGAPVARAVLERLPDEDRWYVIRNWLALLHFFPEETGDLDVIPYLQHGDARVRREALPLALERPGVRGRALALALADPDERNCRTALNNLAVPVPETLVPSLLKRVVTAGGRPEALRVLGIESLAGARSPLVRDALAELASAGRSLLGKVRLADPSPLSLAALAALARDWSEDEKVRPLLDAGRKARDPATRAAAAGESDGGGG